MKRILLTICIVMVLMSNVSRGDDTNLMHFSAHFGMSFAINTFVYQTWYKGLGCTKTESVIAAATITLFTGFMYKYMEAFNASASSLPSNTLQSMTWNTLGVGASFVVLQF
jgi:hypothetical protein